MSGAASAEMARVTAEVTNLVAYGSTLAGLPIPPLNGKFGGSGLFTFGYNALRIDAGIGLGVRDSFVLDPKGATIVLRLDQTGEYFEFGAGDSVSIVYPEGFDEITLTPTNGSRRPSSALISMSSSVR